MSEQGVDFSEYLDVIHREAKNDADVIDMVINELKDLVSRLEEYKKSAGFY